MYSTDRAKALNHTLACLEEMPLYENCQKTLIVDGKIDNIPNDWQVLQIPRNNGKFCWGRMWDAGVAVSRFENIIYLDSDRLLPNNFLTSVVDKIKDDAFLFTSKHFQMLSELCIDKCKEFLNSESMQIAIRNSACIGKVRYEPRHKMPFHGPSKNVMSGSTAFTRKTYLKLGGVDHWYSGHGAYADSDFHMHCSMKQCEFIDLDLLELHFPHNKLDNNIAIDEKTLHKMSLDNFIYYCCKWNLSMNLADNLAVKCGISNPTNYVNKKLKQIKDQLKT